jgi:hypothetical protein
MTPDNVCKEYAKKKVKLTLRFLEDEKGIVIESEREGLEFLGKLFLAQASSEDCGFQLGPFGAGKAFFSKLSEVGLYIHRLHPAPARSNQRGSRKKQTRSVTK